MLTPYAYLADAYLVFVRSLRHVVWVNLQKEFEGEDIQQLWDGRVVRSLANNERPQLEKNVKSLYRRQDRDRIARNPFEALDPSHCAKIISHQHSAFSHVFHDTEETRESLARINRMRNLRFAHPRDTAPSAQEVTVAIRDMLHVLQDTRDQAYAAEIALLTALAATTDALALVSNGDVGKGDGAASPMDDNDDGLTEDGPSPADLLANQEVSPAPKEADEFGDERGNVRENDQHTVDAPTLRQLEKAVRKHRGADGFAPVRYVWSTLELRHPAKYPDEDYLVELLEARRDRFTVKRGKANSSVRVALR